MAPSNNTTLDLDVSLVPSSGKIDQSGFSDIIDSASDTQSNMIRVEDLESSYGKGNITDREEIKPGRKNGKNSSQNNKKDG